MLQEQLEEPDDRDRVPSGPVRGPCGVIHHQHHRNQADMLEDLDQSLAHALRVLARQRDHVTLVRIRKRRHQAMHLGFHARQHHHGLAEIDLHDPGPPFQLHEPVTGGTMFLTPLLHVTLHRGIRAGEPFLRDESVVHAFGGMALLAGHEPVRLQPLVDHGREPVEFPRPRGRWFGFGRAILHQGVFPDRVPGHVQITGDGSPWRPLLVKEPDTLLNRHRYGHSFPFPRTVNGCLFNSGN